MNNHYSYLTDSTPAYSAGWRAAEFWVVNGGDLDAYGPIDTTEDYYSGFIDRLAVARQEKVSTI